MTLHVVQSQPKFNMINNSKNILNIKRDQDPFIFTDFMRTYSQKDWDQARL